MLTHADIARRIPHQGSMCLLDHVLTCDDHHISCSAVSHLLADNPLRMQGRLGAAMGVEYAAQAMALHCALQHPQTAAAQAGYLTSVRDIQLHAHTLDAVAAPLHIHAECIASSPQAAMYQFRIDADGRCLLQGRLAAVLDVSGSGT